MLAVLSGVACMAGDIERLVLQRHFVILGVAVPDMERPPLDDRQLCGLTIMRWPLATA